MSKITQLNEKAWCAEVPDWSKDWYVTNIHADNDLVCPSKYEGVHWIGRLPDGKFSILGRPEEMTEDQWKGIVEEKWTGFKDYDMPSPRMEGSMPTATESGLSLLKSKGLNPETSLILKKIQIYKMTKREPLLKPELDMKVFHEEIYDGNELMTVVGIRKDSVELEGDYSGGTNNVIQKDWFPITGLFRLRKVCHEVEQHGSCLLHNIHCGYPNCEPYLTGTHHYEKGVRIDY